MCGKNGNKKIYDLVTTWKGDEMRILFAEDERPLSKALTTILERNNYSVDAVFDGK